MKTQCAFITMVIYFAVVQSQEDFLVFLNPPDKLSVPEDITPGSTVYTVLISKEIANLVLIEYSFDSKATAETFDVRKDDQSGYIISLRCGAKLDFEGTTTMYNISFTASNNAQPPIEDERRLARQATSNPISSIIVPIVISDVNEAPTFASDIYFLSVAEDTGKYLSDLNLTATDVDQNDGNLTFEIINSYPKSKDSVKIDKTTGKFILPIGYDVDKNSQSDVVLLTVAAIDKGLLSGTTLLVINVVDTNDNAPVFAHKQQTIRISKTLKVNSVVAYVSAYDQDSGNNGNIIYAIKKSQLSKYFQIEKSKGEVTYAEKIPDLEINSFNLTVSATDQGLPTPQESETNINIIVESGTTTTTELATDPTGNGGENINNEGNGQGNLVITTSPTVDSCIYCKTLYNNGTCGSTTTTRVTSHPDIRFLYWLLPLLFFLCTAVILCLLIYCCLTKRKNKKNEVTPRNTNYAGTDVNSKRVLRQTPVSTYKSNSSSVTVENIT